MIKELFNNKLNTMNKEEIREKTQEIVVQAVAGTKDLTEAIDELCILSDANSQKSEIEQLNKIVIEAINLPKGVEPHSYSDYKKIERPMSKIKNIEYIRNSVTNLGSG